MPNTKANGIQIYYELAGTGPRLLFISGTGGDLRSRPNVLDSPLPKAFEVLTYDQRGLGRTDKPATAYRMSDYANDAACLLDGLGWDGVPVMGVSFGGMVAQELALRHPHKVSALVLACTSSGGSGGASYPLHELEALPDEERLARQLALSDLRRDSDWQAANPDRWHQLMEAARSARRADRDEAGARRQLEARAEHDTYARLGALDLPVLITGGRHDGIAPVANLEALATRIPGARLELFDGGHLFLIQDREAYPFIIQWLRDSA